MRVKDMTPEQIATFRQELLARSEARRNSLTGRIERGIMLMIFALACVSAAASLILPGHMGMNPLSSVAGLLAAGYFVPALMGKKPGRLAELGLWVATVLWAHLFLQWLGW